MEDTFAILGMLIILSLLTWLLKFLSQERYIFNKILRKRFNSINWYKFSLIYIFIQLIMNSSLSLIDKICTPITIMFSIFTMIMCNSSIDDINEIKSEPDYELNKKVWMRNRKIDKIL